MTILLIEQNANMALRIADRGYVLKQAGFLSGTGRELLADESVKAAYLGRKRINKTCEGREAMLPAFDLWFYHLYHEFHYKLAYP